MGVHGGRPRAGGLDHRETEKAEEIRMKGKNKCRILKEIRREIAEVNGVPLEIPECTYEGDCSGTCPRCEEEMRILQRRLEEIAKSGRKVVIPDIPPQLLAETGSLREYRFLEDRLDHLTQAAREKERRDTELMGIFRC